MYGSPLQKKLKDSMCFEGVCVFVYLFCHLFVCFPRVQIYHYKQLLSMETLTKFQHTQEHRKL